MDLPAQSRFVAIPCVLGIILFLLSRFHSDPAITAVLSVAALACILAGVWFTRDLMRRLQQQAAELKEKQQV